MADDRFDDQDEAEGASKGPEFEFTLTPAKRHGLKALLLLYGLSGSGKTYSAMRIARGLVGPRGRIGVLDTEHNRAKHYADEFEFEHAMMAPPFSPSRYLKALREFERQGIDCMIVDSMSHVQEGEGGLIEMAAKEEERLGNRVGNGSQWAKPKAEWKKVRNAFLQSKMHIIFCARAKTPLEKGDGNKYVKGDLVPIMPAGFEFEVTVSVGIEVETQQLIHTKMPNQVVGAFPKDQYMSESTGQMLRQWLDGEKIVDSAFEALKEVGREQAAKGVDALKAWYTALDGKNKARIKDYLDEELKPIAAGKKPAQQPAQDADDRPRDPPAREERSSASTETREAVKQKQPEREPEREQRKPAKAETKREEPPPPEEDDRGAQSEFDMEDDEPAPKPATTTKKKAAAEEMPAHSYPPIAMGADPDWPKIAGEIADFIEGSPADVDLICKVYAEHIERMQTEKPRSYRMLKTTIDEAKA